MGCIKKMSSIISWHDVVGDEDKNQEDLNVSRLGYYFSLDDNSSHITAEVILGPISV